MSELFFGLDSCNIFPWRVWQQSEKYNFIQTFCVAAPLFFNIYCCINLKRMVLSLILVTFESTTVAYFSIKELSVNFQIYSLDTVFQIFKFIHYFLFSLYVRAVSIHVICLMVILNANNNLKNMAFLKKDVCGVFHFWYFSLKTCAPVRLSAIHVYYY